MSFVPYTAGALVGAVTAVIAATTLMPTAAYAACEAGPGILEHQLPNANALVANSANDNLRTVLYPANRCRIRAILHQSGSDCIANQGNNHVTVDALSAPGGVKQGRSFHVFDYTAANSAYQCTTR